MYSETSWKLRRAFYLSSLTAVAYFLISGTLLIVTAMSGVKQLQEVTFQQAKRMVILLASISEEKFDKNPKVALSSTISRVVESSKAGSLHLNEAFLLTAEGKLLAHSNVIHLAKNPPRDYDQQIYYAALDRPREDPIIVRALEYHNLAAIFEADNKKEKSDEAMVSGLLPASLPTLIPKKLHVSTAIYRPATGLADKTIHILVTDNSPLNYLKDIVFYYSFYIVGGGVLVVFVFTFFLSLLYSSPPGNSLQSYHHRPVRRIYPPPPDYGNQPVDEYINYRAERHHGGERERIMEAIPLEH